MKRYIILVMLVIALLTATQIGCGRNEVGSQQQTKDSKVYAMNVVVSGVPFWADTRSTWEQISTKREDVKLLYGGPLDTDSQKQIDEIEALLVKGVDGLIIAPADSDALSPIINKAVDQGICVITYLVDAPNSKRLTYIASELEQASIKIGKHAMSSGESKAQALILYAEAGNAEQEARRRGFEILAKDSSTIEIVDVIADKYDETVGAEQVKAALVKYPSIRYIFGCNSRSAVGAVSALKELGFKAGKVVVTGWDADKDVLELIRNGWVKASVVQQSSFMTQQAFAILEAHSRGWLYPSNRRFKKQGVRPVPEHIIVPIDLITAKNVDAFYPQ